MLDTLELYEQLAEAMGPEPARVLAAAMGRLYREITSTVTKEEFGELKGVVEELAEAQRRTEARLEELAQAQARTEARVEELAEAQARTEARVEELAEAQARTEARLEELAQAQARTEARVEELAEAQARTEARLEELAQAQARTEEEVRKLARGLRETRQMVGGLSDTVGYVLEDRAIRSLPRILRERVGLEVEGGLRRTFVEHPDGRATEVNILGLARNAAGETVPVVGEAKARLSRKHVDGLVRVAARLEEEGLLAGSPQLVLVCYSVPPAVQRYAASRGVLVVPSYELDL